MAALHILVFVAFAVLSTLTMAALIELSDYIARRTGWYARREMEFLIAIVVTVQATFMYLAHLFDIWLIGTL